jgi:hypothetical protein
MWESKELAKRLVKERAEAAKHQISEEQLQQKAVSLAYCLRNAREYVRSAGIGSSQWVSRIVADYYGCMWLASAVLVADPTTKYDLAELEERTRFGHGLGNMVDDAKSFPDNELVLVKQSGFFPSYLRHSGVTKEQLAAAQPKNQRASAWNELDEEDKQRAVSLSDLIARVPEIREHFIDVTGKLALSFHIFHAGRNGQEDSERLWAEVDPERKSPPKREIRSTWVGVGDPGVPLEHAKKYGPPLADWQSYTDGATHSTYWCGLLEHPDAEHWHEKLALHKSAMCGTSWIAPIAGSIDDVLALHFMILYGLSILARYRPRRWREVTEGTLDEYRSLISFYLQAYERIIPEVALKRISGRDVWVAQPGSLWAPG